MAPRQRLSMLVPASERTAVRRTVGHPQTRDPMTPKGLALFLRIQRLGAAALAGVVAFPILQLAAQSSPTIDQFLKPGLPLEIISAKKADRIAWIATERGQRNVYTAVAPGFVPVPLTKFRKDDGVPLTQLSISD